MVPSAEDLRAFVWFATFLSGLGAVWIMGRSKVREALISDLQARNDFLETTNVRLEAQNEALKNGIMEGIIEGVLKGLD